jgi:hypothetical protein
MMAPVTQSSAAIGRPAVIIDRRREGRFVADRCVIDPAGWVHAHGEWRIRNLTGELRGQTGDRSWSPSEPLHIEWRSPA